MLKGIGVWSMTHGLKSQFYLIRCFPWDFLLEKQKRYLFLRLPYLYSITLCLNSWPFFFDSTWPSSNCGRDPGSSGSCEDVHRLWPSFAFLDGSECSIHLALYLCLYQEWIPYSYFVINITWGFHRNGSNQLIGYAGGLEHSELALSARG